MREFLAETPAVELIWLTIGFTAQAMFSARFLVQWIASERVRRSIVPELFWYFSFAGGALLFAYAIYRKDPVFILGQGFGLLVYSRNIYFIWAARRGGGEPPEL
ncbi:lipid A biosynthesis [Maritimibacter sp. 55A14]|nr:lipid-A-disaccharide synthase N-terminal domain-containing protein [Maritimibacter sp. 55A14]PWE32197.1 lipid A biosynthesis [Maritimibacter sp. 55A14]